MSWNYRVIKHKCIHTGETWLAVHEVHYDEFCNIEGWTAAPVYPQGETIEELREAMIMYRHCVEKPVLDEAELKKIK